jgi:imidazolonepropionase-like amidohydrolase
MSTRGSIAALAAFALQPALVAPASAAPSHAIVHATAHTISKGVIQDATIVIANGRIVAIGEGLKVPAGAEVIDAKGRPVTPGLFDAFGSLGVVEVELEDSTVDSGNGDLRYSAAYAVADAINPATPRIAIMRIEGLTRALVAPAAGDGDGVRPVIAGQAATIQLGSDDAVLDPSAALVVALGESGKALAGGSRAAALLQLREALEDARDYAANRGAYNEGRRREYARGRADLEALQPVLRGELPVIVRVNRASDIRAALKLGREFNLKLMVQGGAEAWMVAADLKRAGVPVIVDVIQNLPGAFESLGSTLSNAARLQQAGVAVTFATEDAGNPRNIKQLAGIAVANGMDYEAALAGLTAVPAQIYGMKGFGTLDVGMDADVVVWSGDPLEVTTFADVVFIRGARVPMESRQTKLRDRYQDLGKQPWPPAYRNR